MCDTLLGSVCRLCLKDNFSLNSIFTYRSPSGEAVFEVLKCIYDLEICEGDGLPSSICNPCLWRMFEFHTYKKNVSYAEAELKKLLSRSYINSKEVSNAETSNGMEFKAEERVMQVSDAFPEEVVSDRVAFIENEIKIEEWEMPENILSQRNIFENVTSEVGEDVVKETEVLIKKVVEIEEQQQENIQPEKDTLRVSTGNYLGHKHAEYDVGNEELEDIQSTASCKINSSECLGQKDESHDNVSSKNSSSVFSFAGTMGENEANIEICENINEKKRVTEKKSALSLKSKKKSGDRLGESEIFNSEMAVQCEKKHYVCDICKKSFVYKFEIGRHVRIHYSDRPFKCGECAKSFKRYDVKIIHELRHIKKQKNDGIYEKEITKKSYMCKICKKKVSTRRSLHLHSNLHKNKFTCSFCGKRCNSKGSLNTHSKIHSNEKPFSCEVCKRTFIRRDQVTRHMSAHSDDRPFQCNVCEKTFKTKQCKIKHELLHLRE